MRRWTEDELDVLRRLYPTEGGRAVARATGRAIRVVYTKAKELGLRRDYHTPWADHNGPLRRWWAEGVGAPGIARRLGRTAQQVWRQAYKLGLPRHNQWLRPTPEQEAMLAAVAADGRCDRCCADTLGCNRVTAKRVRQRLGLPPGAGRSCACQRLRGEARVREQIARGEHPRTLGYARQAQARGWPVGLSPKHLDVLDVLYERGPHTRRGVAESLGLPWRGRATLSSTGPGGNYLADLVGWGLVVRLPRQREGHLYMIPLGVERGTAS